MTASVINFKIIVIILLLVVVFFELSGMNLMSHLRQGMDRVVPTASDYIKLYETVQQTQEQKSSCPTRFVFIDLGANRADSLRVFLKEENTKFEYDFPVPPNCNVTDAEIYLFEANPVFNKDLVLAKQQYTRSENTKTVKKLEIYPMTIVWTVDTLMPFYLDTVTEEHDFWGSSIMDTGNDIIKSGKQSLDLSAIDIAKFILTRFLPDDFVVVKMDIEGAEYDVVPHLHKTSAGVNIDYLFVEWHPGNNPSEEKKQNAERAVELLKREGVNVPHYDSLA